MLSGAKLFTAHGGQYNAVGRDMSLHLNMGRDTTTPQVAMPLIVLQNTADTPREPSQLRPATYHAANAEQEI